MGFAANAARKFWDKQLGVIRQKGIVAGDEKVEATVSLFKRTQLVVFTGVCARFLQKQYLLIVTDRRVLLVHIPAFLAHGAGYYEHAEAPRPCRLTLPVKPKGEHPIGARVDLPEAFATL